MKTAPRPRRRAASGPRKRRSLKAALPAIPWKKVIIVVACLAIVAAAVAHQVDMAEVHDYAARLDGRVAFALLTVLPLFGFPVNILHIAAGIRFGIPGGLAVVAGSVLIQLLASYMLVNLFRDRFEKWMAPIRERIPEGAHANICVLALLLPGAPFAAINYTLPLIGVPLRTYILCCWPIHVLRSTVTVALGGHSDHLTAARVAGLAAYAALILGVSWWTYRRLRVQLEDQPPAAGGRKQPA